MRRPARCASPTTITHTTQPAVFSPANPFDHHQLTRPQAAELLSRPSGSVTWPITGRDGRAARRAHFARICQDARAELRAERRRCTF